MAEIAPRLAPAASGLSAFDAEDGELAGATTGFVVSYLPKRPDREPQWRVGLRRIGRVVGAALTAALVAAVLGSLFIGYGLVDNRWYHVLGIEGGSMAQTILPGDLIVLARPPAVVEPGMILTLEVDGQIVTHRVFKVLPDGRFITKGDANDVPDDFGRNRVRVVGQYIFRIPAIGSALSALHRVTAPRSGAWLVDRAAVGAEAVGAPEAEAAPLMQAPDMLAVEPDLDLPPVPARSPDQTMPDQTESAGGPPPDETMPEQPAPVVNRAPVAVPSPVVIPPPSPDPSASPDPSPPLIDSATPTPTDAPTAAPSEAPALMPTPSPTDAPSPTPTGG